MDAAAETASHALMGTSAIDEIRCLVYGSEGVADTDYMGAVQIRGKHPFEGGRMTDLYTSGARRNIESFYNAVAGAR